MFIITDVTLYTVGVILIGIGTCEVYIDIGTCAKIVKPRQMWGIVWYRNMWQNHLATSDKISLVFYSHG